MLTSAGIALLVAGVMTIFAAHGGSVGAGKWVDGFVGWHFAGWDLMAGGGVTMMGTMNRSARSS